MKNKNLSPAQFSHGGYTLLGTLASYLVIVVVSLSVLIADFNSLITQHDKKLTVEICNLVTEKMNNSIRYMTSSAENMSVVLSAQNFRSPDEIYSMLSGRAEGNYISIGFIDENEKIYASDNELGEFEKWNLLAFAELADPVSISAPYRSAATGQPVFTMFADFSYDSGKNGWLFVTYPLSEIQNMASTQSLKNETEIWLMNAASANIIQCAGLNQYSIGSWNNALLSMKEINSEDRPAYTEWRKKMIADEASANLIYNIGDISYTQVYSKINFMPGWYVVVRIPSSSLSDTMQKFRTSVLVFVVVLLIATLILFILMHKRNTHEKRMLENLSIHDPLTSVMNRRAFDFTAEQRLSHTSNGEASLLFFDVDYFKQVNDRFGHESGDRILKEFSAALRGEFGEIGYISRFGGDEFVVLLNTDSKDEVNRRLEHLMQTVHNIKPSDDPSVYGDFVLSFSAGAACFPKDAETLKELEACADSALYAVKEKGRNGYGWYEKNS